MERFIHTDRKSSNKRKRIARQGFTALLMGCSTVLTAAGAFDIYLTATGWHQGGQFLSALGCMWNKIAYKLLIEKGLVLKEVSGAGEDCQLMLLLLMLLFSAISWMILQSRNTWLLLLPAAIVFGPALSFDLQLQPVAAAVFVLAVSMSYAEIKHDDGTNIWQWLYMAAVVMVIVLMSSSPQTKGLFDKPDAVAQIDYEIEDFAEKLYYGENLLSNGEVTGAARNSGSDDIALTVTMERPDSLYLRGFVGELFQNDQWEQLPYGAYYETKNLIYWLNDSGFSGIGQVGAVKEMVSEGGEVNHIAVTVEHADTRYAYVPYEIKSFDDKALLWYEGYFMPKNTGRLKTYSYTAGENAVKEWTDITGRFFTTEKNDEINTYLQQESYYNQLVYSYYTHLTDKDRDLLESQLGDCGDQSKGHIEYKTAIQKIMEYLDKEILYTETPAFNMDAEGTAMEAFFREHKGYDVHYATAATLMFRYYGIPARYVEGYLITPDDAQAMEPGEPMGVPEARIHAWTEIYIDGIGFVPVETCPAYRGVMEEADLNIGLDNEAVKRQFNLNQEPKEQPESLQKTQEAEDTDSVIIRILLGILAIFLLLMVLWGLYQAGKKLSEAAKRRKHFVTAPAKEAVCYIYRYMELLRLPIHTEARLLGNRAAYSTEAVSEEDRRQMLTYLKALKKEKRKSEKKYLHINSFRRTASHRWMQRWKS